MADGHIQIASDGTGKKVDNSVVQIGGEDRYRQRTVITSDNNPSAFATIVPAGFLRVSDEPRQIFYDPFETLDATDRWLAGVTSGGGVAAAVANGDLTLGTGTATPGASTRSTRFAFTPPVPGFLVASFAIRHEWPVTANTYRFWGLGQKTGTPTAAAPLTDGVGFELATDGKMHAVVYAAGVRTSVQDLSAATGNSKQPTDALGHRYLVYYRTDRIYFYIDNLDLPVATAGFVSPQVQVLPLHLAAIAGTSAPASSGVLTVMGAAVSDTGKNASSLSDGTFPWRRAGVTPKGTQGAFALATQDLRDSGRQAVTIAYNQAGSLPTSRTLLTTAVKTIAGVQTTGLTSVPVTSGKTLRITNISISMRATVATNSFSTFDLVMNPSGAAVLGSPILTRQEFGGTAAVVGNTAFNNVPISEGMEFSGTQQIGLVLTTNLATNVAAITLFGYEF